MAQLEIKPTRRQVVGSLVVIVAAAAIAVTLVLLLIGGGGDLLARRTTLTAYMPDATGVAGESVVRLGGIPIGKVSRFRLSGLLDRQRAVRVEMRVVTRYLKSIPEDSQTRISADTLVGYPFIDISPGKSRNPIGENGVLQSEPLQQASDRADQLKAISVTFRQIDDLLGSVISHDSDIGKFVYRSSEYDFVNAKVGEFSRGMHAFINPQNQLGQAFYSPEAYDDIRRTVLRTDQALASIQAGEGSAGHLFASDEQYADAVRTLKDLHAALADLNAGKGAFGKMLQEDQVYRDIRARLAHTDALLASLNAGEGQAGELLRSPQLYESLNGALRELDAMLRDVREKPKRYLRYKF